MDLNDFLKDLESLEANPSITAEENRPTVDEALAELDAIEGLDSVKNEIKDRIKFVQVMKKRSEAGLVVPTLSHNMVFVGGSDKKKAIVARALAKIYYALEIIDREHIVEVGRDDLISCYVGQTTVFTAKAVEDAVGGVLFVNKAHQIIPDPKLVVDLRYEAIETLTLSLEERRTELVAVLSGKREALTQFISARADLRANFATVIDFGEDEDE